MKKYPVGPETWNKAKNTKSGQLASVMRQILYNSDIVKDKEFVVNNNKMYFISDIPESIRIDKNYVDVEKALREICDHLEFLALQEVIP